MLAACHRSQEIHDLETETGVFENVMGHVEGDYLFWAKSAEKIGDKTVRIKSAVVTTCSGWYSGSSPMKQSDTTRSQR